VLISNGRLDPLVPAAETDRLADLLRSAGADVTVNWHQAGHQLLPDDITGTRAWLAALASGKSRVSAPAADAS
jgi:predicted esterase